MRQSTAQSQIAPPIVRHAVKEFNVLSQISAPATSVLMVYVATKLATKYVLDATSSQAHLEAHLEDALNCPSMKTIYTAASTAKKLVQHLTLVTAKGTAKEIGGNRATILTLTLLARATIV